MAAARDLYAAPPVIDKELGLVESDFPPVVVEVWPDCWEVVQFFAAVGPGAWNAGPGGFIGIRPEAFREIRLALGISAGKWREFYPDVMVMEDAALAEIRRDK